MTPPTITERFPPLPLDEIVSQIRAFPNSTTDEKKAFLQRLVTLHPIMAVDWGEDWRYRRARALKPDELPPHVDHTIWNKNTSPKLGRANPEGFPVLYLADRVNTALAETHIDDQKVMLSEFKIHPGHSVRIAPIGELFQLQRSGRGLIAGDASGAVTDMLNSCDRDQAESLVIADAFLLEVLTNRADDYELSSMIAMAVFEKLPQVQAVAFPSTRAFGGLCFAVKIDEFWKTWGLASVRCVHATHLGMEYYRLTKGVHVEGITNSGDLVWQSEPDRPDMVLALEPLWTPAG